MIHKTFYRQRQQLKSERQLELVCDLEECPHCANQPFESFSALRRFCSAPAREEYIRRQRVAQALAKRREPGRRGRDRADGAVFERGYFCLLLLEDQLAKDYQVMVFATEQACLAWIEVQDKSACAALLEREIAWPQSLLEKLERSFPLSAGRRCLTEPAVKIAMRMVEEHARAYLEEEGLLK